MQLYKYRYALWVCFGSLIDRRKQLHMKKALALILSLLIVLAMIPPAAAAGEVAVAMLSAPKDGDRIVMYYPNGQTVVGTVATGQKLKGMEVTLSDNQMTLPENAAIFDVSVNSAGEYAFCVNGKYLTTGATGGSLTFADSLTDYGLWTLESVAGKGYLVRNKKAVFQGKPQYIEDYNGFTTFSYKETNQKFFLLQFYQLLQQDTVAAPIADPASGAIRQGTTVRLTCATEGAAIFFGFDQETFSAYTEPIEIRENCTIYAYAEKNGTKSPTQAFPYTVYTDVLNVKQALLAGDMASAKVVGQLVYRFGNAGGINSAVIQAEIDGEIYALQVYNALENDADGNSIGIGDWLVLTGKLGPYGQVQQIQSLKEIRKATPEEIAGGNADHPQVYESFADVDANYADLISEYILIKNVTLGEYRADGSTTLTDAYGAEMPLYKGAPYPAGIEAGDTVDLYCVVSKYYETKQLRNGSSKDYVPTEDTEAPVITRVSLAEAEVGKNYSFTVKVEDASGVASVRMEVFRGDALLKTFDSPTVEDDSYTILIPGWNITGGDLTVRVTATDTFSPPNTAVESFAITVIDLPQILEVSPEANSATGANKRPTILVSFANCGAYPTVEMTLNGAVVEPIVTGSAAYYTPTEDLEDGKVTVWVKVTRLDGKSFETNWSFTIGAATYRLYFGQLHSHTAEYSDGTGTLAQALAHAKAAQQIDFLAVTDHSNCFDGADCLGDLTDASKGLSAAGSTLTKWQKAKLTAAEYADDTFIPIIGFEMTWAGQYGHMNTYHSVGVESRNNPDYVIKNGPGLVNYYNRLAEVARIDRENGRKTTISQFNHPGKVFGTFEDFAHYSPAYDELITMIEVGNGEGKVGGSMYFPSYQYYTMALDKGWHLAPTNNQDNHKGGWGDSNTCRDVIYTDNFSEEGIYDAMRSMTMYATEDNDLEIYYTLNGHVMGSILNVEPGETLTIRVDFKDPTDRVQKISVLANGGAVVASKTFNSKSGSWEISLENSYSYYYVRVDEVDSDIAVTAPVWTNDTVKIGISPIETDTAAEWKDAPITFRVPLYNYEEPAIGENASAADFTITKAVFSIDGKVVSEIEDPQFTDGGSTLNAEKQDGVLEWTYTPTETGRMRLEVRVTGTFRGTEYSFDESLALTVRDGDAMSLMLIDAGHDNFYISGKYPDSDEAFIALAAQYDVKAEHVSEPITDAVLENCDILVLTVPFKADYNAGGYLYSEEELEAIRNFAARGGSFIVCAKSDRCDPSSEEQTASAISNTLLDAIGAKARVSKGIVSDAVNMTNESYRLHFTGKEFYNWDNPLNEYLIENTNLMFSCYNAAPVILNGAQSVVNAYDTSFVSSYPLFYDNGKNVTADKIYQPYYDACGDQDRICVLAYEELPAGGFCITSGVTFFSTFEVRVEMENAATLQNANYQIVLNLFGMIHPSEVTPIAEIHEAGGLNVPYTIEGYVTSHASGYDRDTAFFDCIYVQDESGRGINVFPVAGRYEIGQKLRISGMTSEYMGELELNCGSDCSGEIRDVTLRDRAYTADGETTVGYATRARLLDVTITTKNKQTVDPYVIDDSALNAVVDEVCAENRLTIVEPTDNEAGVFLLENVTTAEAASSERVGSLVSFGGRVIETEFDANGVLGAIRVDDGSGEVVVFLDGYINCDDACQKDEQGYHDLSWVRTGEFLTVRGIVSVGQNSYAKPDRIGPRVRIRNRADIVRVEPLYGDANCDGKVDSGDAAEVLSALVGLSTLTPEGMRNADVCADFDGYPNAADAAEILRYVLGLIEVFDVENAG